MEITDEQLQLILGYAYDVFDIQMCLEQAEEIAMRLSNPKRNPKGWGEEQLANELKHRFG